MDKENVLKSARLARIKLSAEEEEELAGSLKNIFQHFNNVASVSDEGALPLYHPLEGLEKMTSFRPDEIKAWENTEELLKQAPELLERGYKTPPVIE